ncbi:alpha/beta fold hydrolase [Nocardia sp. NPDC059240]|uniref:alpha/beta fold hydrolase n=1 Tax=Nocardia sp. NPDC059240 TaxID=3346786 RepID=UPI0036B236E1
MIERPDGTKLWGVAAGTGPDVLLVHGFGVPAESYSMVQPALVSAGRRVVAYDQRGHGRSSCGADGIGSDQFRGDLRAVADHYDLRDATLVCHSMGNFVALGLLTDPVFRKRISRAVLVSPITGNSSKGAPGVVVQGPLIQLGLAQRLASGRRVGSMMAAQSLGPGPSPVVLEASRLSMAAIPTVVGPAVTMLRKESVEGVLPDIDLPLYVLTGTADRTTPSWHAELIVARAQDARIDYVADGGHMLNWEAPEHIVRAALEEWVD